MSNTNGRASLFSQSNYFGVGISAPICALDILGDMRASGGLYTSVPAENYKTARASCLLGVAGDAIVNGTLWSQDRIFSYTGVHSKIALMGGTINTINSAASNYNSNTATPAVNYSLPISTSEILDCAAGDATMSNVLARGAVFVDGPASIIGRFTANDAIMQRVVLSGGNSNFHTNMVSSNMVVSLEGTYPIASSNANLSNKLLEVHGDAALNANFALRSNAYIGGTVFVGSNMNSSAPTIPNSIVSEFSNVSLDVQGDVVFENNLYTKLNSLVDGNFGVGTHSPAVPVDVQKSVGGVSLTCTAKVVASEFVVYSDRRIKTNITDYVKEDVIDLLHVKEFDYIDGGGSMIGFIAQDVEGVAPYCVDTSTGYIPDIFQEFELSTSEEGRESQIFQIDFDGAGLSEDTLGRSTVGEVLKCRRGGEVGGETIFATITSTVDKLVSVYIPQIKPSDGDRIFVVGTMVEDFKMIRHDQINAIAVTAIKNQNIKIREFEKTVAMLVTKMTA